MECNVQTFWEIGFPLNQIFGTNDFYEGSEGASFILETWRRVKPCKVGQYLSSLSHTYIITEPCIDEPFRRNISSYFVRAVSKGYFTNFFYFVAMNFILKPRYTLNLDGFTLVLAVLCPDPEFRGMQDSFLASARYALVHSVMDHLQTIAISCTRELSRSRSP